MVTLLECVVCVLDASIDERPMGRRITSVLDFCRPLFTRLLGKSCVLYPWSALFTLDVVAMGDSLKFGF